MKAGHGGGGGAGSPRWCLGADPRPELTSLYPRFQGRNWVTPVELVVTRGPRTGTRWSE